MGTESRKGVDETPKDQKGTKFEKMYCKACSAHFWIDPDIELATPDYVCPYCGESKDVVRSKAEERKK